LSDTRGLITQAKLGTEITPHDGLDWITALRAPAIQAFAEGASFRCRCSTAAIWPRLPQLTIRASG
jgi:hypothetical protein